MRIITKAILDMESLQWVSVVSHDYFGPLELCGGGSPDPVAVEQEQSQASFDNTLQQIFQSQYATQAANLKYLTAQLEPSISAGGEGYTPTQLAAQRTGATDTNSEQYQNAQDALNNQVSQASGGSKLAGVSGAVTESDAALLNAEAQQQAQSQQTITSNNANLQQSNYWNAINALNGVAAEDNPLGYASSASSAANASANDANANTNHIQATASPIWGAIGGAFGGIGSALSGGFSAGGLFNGCWIFASFFGWDDIRTYMMRLWLHTRAPKWFRNFYLSYGERIAKNPLRWAFRPIATYVLQTSEI